MTRIKEFRAARQRFRTRQADTDGVANVDVLSIQCCRGSNIAGLRRAKDRRAAFDFSYLRNAWTGQGGERLREGSEWTYERWTGVQFWLSVFCELVIYVLVSNKQLQMIFRICNILYSDFCATLKIGGVTEIGMKRRTV